MTNQAPWSIKGVDSNTRKKMKAIAEETGVTLAELLSELLDKKSNDTSESDDNIHADNDELNNIPKGILNLNNFSKAKNAPLKKSQFKKQAQKTTAVATVKDNQKTTAVKKSPTQSKGKATAKATAKTPAKNTAKITAKSVEVNKAKAKTATATKNTTSKNSGTKNSVTVGKNAQSLQKTSQEVKIAVKKSVPVVKSAHKPATKPVAKSVTQKTASQPAVTVKKQNTPKTVSVFNSLLDKTASTAKKSKNAVILQKMPEHTLENIVFESRDLRNALRIHTQELAQEIQQNVASQIAALNGGVPFTPSEYNGDVPQNNLPNYDVFLHETQSIGNNVVNHIEEIKAFLLEMKAQNVDTGALRNEMHTMMQRNSAELLNSVEEKINAFLVQNMQSAEPDSAMLPYIMGLNKTVEKIVSRLMSLEQTCQNLENSVHSGGNDAESQKVEQLRQELSQFIHDMPIKVKEIFSASDMNLEQMKHSLSNVMNRIDTVEQYTKQISLENHQDSAPNAQLYAKLDSIQNYIDTLLLQNKQNNEQKNEQNHNVQSDNYAHSAPQQKPIDTASVASAYLDDEFESVSPVKTEYSVPSANKTHNQQTGLSELLNQHSAVASESVAKPFIQPKFVSEDTDLSVQTTGQKAGNFVQNQNDGLENIDAWDDNDHKNETENGYDNLGFSQDDAEQLNPSDNFDDLYYDDDEDNQKDSVADMSRSYAASLDKNSPRDIRHFDHAELNKTRKDALGQLNNKSNASSGQKAPNNILGNFLSQSSKKNAIILGGVSLSVVGLIALIAMI